MLAFLSKLIHSPKTSSLLNLLNYFKITVDFNKKVRMICALFGGMAERLNAPVLKTGIGL